MFVSGCRCTACEEGGVEITMREQDWFAGDGHFFYLHLFLFQNVLRGRTIVKTSPLCMAGCTMHCNSGLWDSPFGGLSFRMLFNERDRTTIKIPLMEFLGGFPNRTTYLLRTGPFCTLIIGGPPNFSSIRGWLRLVGVPSLRLG